MQCTPPNTNYRTVNEHHHSICLVRASKKGDIVVSLDNSGCLIAWDNDLQTMICRIETKGNVDDFSFLENGLLLAWGTGDDSDGILRLWNLQEGTCVRELAGHEKILTGASYVGGGKALSWARDSTIRYWNLDTGSCLAVFSGHELAIVKAEIIANGDLLSVACDGSIRTWNLESGIGKRILDVFERNPYIEHFSGSYIALSDCRIVTHYYGCKTIKVWNLKTLDLDFEIDVPRECRFRAGQPYDGPLFSIVETHSDRLLLRSKKMEGVLVIDCQNRVSRFLKTGGDSGIGNLIYSGDDSFTLWGKFGGDDNLEVWDFSSFQRISICKGHNEAVFAVMPSGFERIVSYSKDRTIRCWSTPTGECVSVTQLDFDLSVYLLLYAGDKFITADGKTLIVGRI